MVVSLSGGLSNQMFQYAFGRSLSLERHEELFLDKSSYEHDPLRHYELDCFNLDIKFAYPGEPCYHETSLVWHEVPRASCYRGYFQTEKYFLPHRDTILREFSVFRGTPNRECEQMAFNIMSTESCFIGVRRADYLWPERIWYHGVMPVEYYLHALEHFPEDTRCFIFTDDIPWALENLGRYGTIVDVNGPTEKHWDIWLMSLSKNAIIANSTFHFFGAYLGPDMTGKVIAPKKWFATDIPNEIVPTRWLTI